MVRVTTGDQADTPITPILTGIAGSGGTATGAIGSARRDVLSAIALAKAEGLPKSEPAFASPCPPRPWRRLKRPAAREAKFYRNFITLN